MRCFTVEFTDAGTARILSPGSEMAYQVLSWLQLKQKLKR